VVQHHLSAKKSVETFDWKNVSTEGGPLNLANSQNNSLRALKKLESQRKKGIPGVLQDVNLNDAQVDDLVEFLKTLTDPCLKEQTCLAKWIPGPNDPDPDGLRLCAKDRTGKELWPASCEPSRWSGR
jgi:cytochrome c peroxidase